MVKLTILPRVVPPGILSDDAIIIRRVRRKILQGQTIISAKRCAARRLLQNQAIAISPTQTIGSSLKHRAGPHSHSMPQTFRQHLTRNWVVTDGGPPTGGGVIIGGGGVVVIPPVKSNAAHTA